MLDTEHDHYLIFTAKEIWLYSLKLGLNAKNLHPLPYGDWQREIRPELLPPIQMIRGYYFAGGYTNRDYGSLISAFRNRSEMLIIACAHLNTEISRSSDGAQYHRAAGRFHATSLKRMSVAPKPASHRSSTTPGHQVKA